MLQDRPLIQQALQELHLDTPYYAATIDPGANGVVFHLYGGRVVHWQAPAAAAAPRSRRRKTPVPRTTQNPASERQT